MSSNYEWVLGMIINIIGSVMCNFGTNLMKKSHIITGSIFYIYL